MRLKLLIIASLLAGFLDAALCLLAIFSFASTPLALLAPAAVTIAACIFVYRHTARRRAIQALLTALGATLISLLIVCAAYRYMHAGVRERIVRHIPFMQNQR
jgi:branched-subunit amino acid ABC-type transport system permease component